MKKALITGITGRIDHIYRDPHEMDVRMFLHYGDLKQAVREKRANG